MESINRKILFELFASPWTLIPVVGGLTLTVASWAIGSALLGFGGVMGALAGVGILYSRLLFAGDEIAQTVQNKIIEVEERNKAQRIEQLKLWCAAMERRDEPRLLACLEDLLDVQKFLSRDKEDCVVATLREDFDDVFNNIVNKMLLVKEGYNHVKPLRGKRRKEANEKLDEAIEEIEQITNKSCSLIRKFQEDKSKIEQDTSLQELEKSIELAKKVDNSLTDLERKGYDLNEFRVKGE